jgi:hypothetical protein
MNVSSIRNNRDSLVTMSLSLMLFFQTISCKIFTTIWQYSLMANYNWILMEGIYLHNLIFFHIFNDNSSIFYYVIFGWGKPFNLLLKIYLEFVSNFKDILLVVKCIYFSMFIKFLNSFCVYIAKCHIIS